MEKLVIAFLGLLIVLFIGNVIYKEAFADCASPGAMTWTITLDPGKCGTITPGAAPSADAAQADDKDQTLPEPGASPTIRDNVVRDISGNLGIGVKKDASGNWGNWLNLSLSDIASLLTTNKTTGYPFSSLPSMPPTVFTPYVVPLPPPPPSAVAIMTNPAGVAMAGSGNTSGLQNQFQGPLTPDINGAAWPLLGAPNDPNTYLYTPMTNQGQQYLDGSPMNNPADLSTDPAYIRRDSIPCWACNP